MIWIKTKIGKWKAYIKNNKVLTLVLVSLLGGIPGIINIHDWATDKPEFLFHIQGHSNAIDNGPVGTMRKYYFIYGAIYNPGKQPLFPTNFHLKVKLNNGQIVEAFAMMIDDKSRSAINKTQGPAAVRLSETTVDLMQTTRVNAKDAQYGVLLFPFGYTDNDFSTPKSFTITCTDITQKGFTQTIILDNNNAGDGFIPKSRVEFKKTDPS